ncbi:MAG: tRNA dihydrouridine synthase DusB [Ignavibacteria bacterium]|nr:tRNA dihydrouridine synthase DusB [Ignavibacteria bacterium]
MLPDFRGKILLAPMEDVTEPPFRLICKRLGADVVYTEFISSEGLIRDARKAKEKLFFYEEERPIAIQIYGGIEESMAESAKICESAGPDFIDINCGCWVKNVALRGAGAGLLRDLPKMKRIAQAVMSNTNLPVTLKTRLGWDADTIVIVDVAKMLEDIGIKALTVHCRLRSQGNKGEADWTWIKKIKEAGVKIPVILNGGIQCPQDVKFVFETYQPDAVMIGQGAIFNPWIFKQSKDFLQTGKYNEPLIEEKIKVLKEHLALNVRYKGEIKGIIEFRKFYSGYLRNLPEISRYRAELMKINSYNEVLKKLEEIQEKYTSHIQTEPTYP